jgi:hypothetical protein
MTDETAPVAAPEQPWMDTGCHVLRSHLHQMTWIPALPSALLPDDATEDDVLMNAGPLAAVQRYVEGFLATDHPGAQTEWVRVDDDDFSLQSLAAVSTPPDKIEASPVNHRIVIWGTDEDLETLKASGVAFHHLQDGEYAEARQTPEGHPTIVYGRVANLVPQGNMLGASQDGAVNSDTAPGVSIANETAVDHSVPVDSSVPVHLMPNNLVTYSQPLSKEELPVSLDKKESPVTNNVFLNTFPSTLTGPAPVAKEHKPWWKA